MLQFCEVCGVISEINHPADIHLQTDLGFKRNGFKSSLQHAFPSYRCDYRQPLEGCRTSVNPFYMRLAHLPPVWIREMAGMGVSWSCGGAEGGGTGSKSDYQAYLWGPEHHQVYYIGQVSLQVRKSQFTPAQTHRGIHYSVIQQGQGLSLAKGTLSFSSNQQRREYIVSTD